MSVFLGRDYYRNAPTVTAERGRRNGYQKHTVLTGEGPVEHCDLSLDGRLLATSAKEPRCRAWDLATGSVVREFAPDGASSGTTMNTGQTPAA